MSADLAILSASDFHDLPRFTLVGQSKYARITDVYDGDTVTVVIVVGGAPMKFSMRLAGYDAPEMKPPKQDPLHDLHQAAAKVARDILASMVLGNIFIAEFTGEDKYGRLLGTLRASPSGATVNDEMLARGLAKRYGGGKKEPFDERFLRAIAGSAMI